MTKKQRTSGMVLGKFMPPHRGHMHLIETAQKSVDDLMIVVGTLASEPIDGKRRHQWMSELFPTAQVLHHTDENPQYPHEHPQFWDIWRNSLNRIMPQRPDYVFASDDYGERLAQELGATFVQVDRGRTVVPISGTAIRNDPMGNWNYLPECVRPYYLKRICIFGPESTGKTTLTQALAERFDTVMVPEFARQHLESKSGQVTRADMPAIARGQAALEDTLALNANKAIFCDTDVLTTTIWSQALFGECDPEILQEALARHYDLYLLTDIDVPWEADPVRYFPDNRQSFWDQCVDALEKYQRPYLRVSGSLDERLEQVTEVISSLIR